MPIKMEEQLERIKQKITIGGLSLGPVLPEREVAAFENRHSVTLPDGYRRFLREVGNGGDGPPYYGLARLGEAASDGLGRNSTCLIKTFHSASPGSGKGKKECGTTKLMIGPMKEEPSWRKLNGAISVSAMMAAARIGT